MGCPTKLGSAKSPVRPVFIVKEEYGKSADMRRCTVRLKLVLLPLYRQGTFPLAVPPPALAKASKCVNSDTTAKTV